MRHRDDLTNYLLSLGFRLVESGDMGDTWRRQGVEIWLLFEGLEIQADLWVDRELKASLVHSLAHQSRWLSSQDISARALLRRLFEAAKKLTLWRVLQSDRRMDSSGMSSAASLAAKLVEVADMRGR